jgi:hypothetical protein
MKSWVSPTLALVLLVVSGMTAAKADPCVRDKSRNCLNVPATINFSSVPEISKQIVGKETPQQPQKNPAKTEPGTAPYTGPIIGLSPLRSRLPTVGFSWSLD